MTVSEADELIGCREKVVKSMHCTICYCNTSSEVWLNEGMGTHKPRLTIDYENAERVGQLSRQ